MDRIYLDYAATTPLDRRVLDEMLPYFTENFGNPSSSHYFGQRAEMALEKSRSSVAHWLGAYEDEVYFTSGGSESDNLALRGTAFSRRKKFGADTILISPVEHHAVSSTARQLMNNFGFRLIELRVDNYGIVNLDDLREQINNRVALVSIVYANNEIGSINPIEDISRICNEKGVPFHSDAVQACAHMEINQLKYKPDLLSIAAHKLYGPKGVGALVCRKGLSITSQITGGNQENSLRAGTHNVPGIIGLAKALEITNQEMEVQNQKLVPLRDRVIESVLSNIHGSHLTGHPSDRLPNHASFVFEKINGNELVIMLDMAGFACSSSSACKVGDPKPSDILLAINLQPDLALGSLRLTLGRQTTLEHIESFLSILPDAVKKLRK